jgi:D-xylonolactonase
MQEWLAMAWDTAGVKVLELGTPEVVVDHPSACGEGPLWNEDEQKVYWVDIPNGELYRYDPASGVNELVYKDEGNIGGYTFQTDGSILLFGTAGKIQRLKDGAVTVLHETVPGEEDGRFNDVHAAPDGGVFCGTMPTATHLASLYRLAPDGSITRIYDDIGLSNGFGFSPDNRIMYFTDSEERLIYAIDYDAETGALGNRRVLVRTQRDASVPDGMTCDADGFLWSARWDGHALYKYSPAGEALGTVQFPVQKVSSIAFGGPDYATAWVTSAGGPNRSDDEGQLAGSLFKVDLGVKGRPPFKSRVLVD